MAPKVSICIPAYNQPESLRRALFSALNQDFEDAEIVITDDTSDDSIENIINNIHATEKIRYYKNASRKGTPGNWNQAIKLASGEYIKILHHDDWFSSASSLGKFVDLLEKNPDTDLAFCSSLNINPAGQMVNLHQPPESVIKNITRDPTLLFLGNQIGSPSATIFRKQDHLEFDENLKFDVDIDFYIRLLTTNPKLAYTKENLINITAGSQNQVTAQFKWNGLEVFERFYLYYRLPEKSYRPNYQRLRVLWDLCTKYNISNEKSLREFGIDCEIDPYILQMLHFQRVRLAISSRLSSFIFWIFRGLSGAKTNSK